jgi:hypothetical protein
VLSRLHKTLDLFAYWGRRLTTSRYVQKLEQDNRELKAKVDALSDTVFGLRGLPPMHQRAQAQAAPPAPLATAGPVNQNQPVPPVLRGTQFEARRKVMEQSRLAEKEMRDRQRAHLTNLQNELNEEIKRSKAEQDGESASIPEPAVEAPAEEEASA